MSLSLRQLFLCLMVVALLVATLSADLFPGMGNNRDLVILRAWGSLGVRKRAMILEYTRALDGFADFVVLFDATVPDNRSRLVDTVRFLDSQHVAYVIYTDALIRDTYPHTTFEVGYRTSYDPSLRSGVTPPLTYQGSPPAVCAFLFHQKGKKFHNKRVWIVEDDMMFAGNIKVFFQRYVAHSEEILTTRLRPMPKGWWWVEAWTYRPPESHWWVQEDHLTRYSVRVLEALDNHLASGVYSIGVQMVPSLCSGWHWCTMASIDESVGPTELYSWQARINRTFWEALKAGLYPSLTNKWVHALKFDEPADDWTPVTVGDPPSSPDFRPSTSKLHGVSLAWEYPPGVAVPRAVLLLLPSCAVIHMDFWLTPQNRKLLRSFLRMHYVLLSPNGLMQNRTSYSACPDYRFHPKNRDVTQIAIAVKTWIAKHNLTHLPLLGYGISAGGSVLSMLSTKLAFRAAVFHVSYGCPAAFSPSHPPVLFSTMQRDYYATVDKVTSSQQVLASFGVSSAVVQDVTDNCQEPQQGNRWFDALTPSMSAELLNYLCKTRPDACQKCNSTNHGWAFNSIPRNNRIRLVEDSGLLSRYKSAFLRYYKSVAIIDQLAWSASDPWDRDTWRAFPQLIRMGYITCANEECRILKTQIGDADWAVLESLVLKKAYWHVRTIVELFTYGLLVYEHSTPSGAGQTYWIDWYERHLYSTHYGRWADSLHQNWQVLLV